MGCKCLSESPVLTGHSSCAECKCSVAKCFMSTFTGSTKTYKTCADCRRRSAAYTANSRSKKAVTAATTTVTTILDATVDTATVDVMDTYNESTESDEISSSSSNSVFTKHVDGSHTRTIPGLQNYSRQSNLNN